MRRYQFAARRLSSTGLVALIACHGDFSGVGPPPQVKLRDCTIDLGPGWPGMSGSVSLSLPTGCPITLAGPRQLKYASTATFNYYSPYTRIVSTQVKDDGSKDVQANFITYSWQYTPPSGRGSDTTDVVQFSGTYGAGDSLGTSRCANPKAYLCEDRVYHTIQRKYPENGVYTATTTVHIPYQFGVPLLVDGQTAGLNPGQSYQLAARVRTPLLEPPVSYEWSQDGQVVSSDTVVWGVAGEPFSESYWTLRMTDAVGTAYSASARASVGSGCGNQVICDGGGGMMTKGRAPRGAAARARP